MKIEIVKRSSLHILQKTFRFLTTVFNGEKKNRDNAEHILVYEREMQGGRQNASILDRERKKVKKP